MEGDPGGGESGRGEEIEREETGEPNGCTVGGECIRVRGGENCMGGLSN
jgi:hypothetical protein